MAKRIFTEGNYIVIDQDNGGRLFYLPQGDAVFINKVDRFVISAHLRGGGGGDSVSVLFSDVANWYASDGTTAYSEASLRSFLTLYTGFKLAGSSALPTGWATHIDTQAPNTAGAITLAGNVDHELPNNNGSGNTSQLPNYIGGSVVDVANNGVYDYLEIKGRNNDGVDIMAYFFIIPSVVNQYIEVWVDITGGTGSPADLANLYRDIKSFPKGAEAERPVVYNISSAFISETWEANKGVIMIRSNATFDIHTCNVNVDINHKAR
jgi:hypothetical protein